MCGRERKEMRKDENIPLCSPTFHLRSCATTHMFRQKMATFIRQKIIKKSKFFLKIDKRQNG